MVWCVWGPFVYHFLQEEIKAIVQKRRDFEFLLRRRTARKADFLRYIEYEMNLEELRRLRKVEYFSFVGGSISPHFLEAQTSPYCISIRIFIVAVLVTIRSAWGC